MISAKVDNKEVKTVSYPKLMVSKLSSMVVLFFGYGCGTVIVSDGMHPTARYASNWDEGAFNDLQGSVTLSNV